MNNFQLFSPYSAIIPRVLYEFNYRFHKKRNNKLTILWWPLLQLSKEEK